MSMFSLISIFVGDCLKLVTVCSLGSVRHTYIFLWCQCFFNVQFDFNTLCELDTTLTLQQKKCFVFRTEASHLSKGYNPTQPDPDVCFAFLCSLMSAELLLTDLNLVGILSFPPSCFIHTSTGIFTYSLSKRNSSWNPDFAMTLL